MNNNLLSIIKNRQPIPKNLVEFIPITGDGNCLYRSTSYYLYGHENEYNNIRQKVYNEEKIHKNDIKPFFLSDNTDDTILNIKLENYIEKIKENYFYGGIIEMGIISNYYDLNISVYISDNNNLDNYIHYTNIWKENNIKNIMILHYDNRIEHFSILQSLNSSGANIKSQIIPNNTTNNFQLIFKDANSDNNKCLKTNNYVRINNSENYYNDIFNHLYSKKINQNKPKKEYWKNLIYPKEINETENMTIRDKKRQNYRELCEKYLLGDDNILYIKLKNKNNEIEKYRIPYESEKTSLFYKFHDINGHISYKRLLDAIKEEKFYWKSIRNDCKNYIMNCPTYIIIKS